MEVLSEAWRNHTKDGEVNGPGKSNSGDGDTHTTNFIVWLWEEFGETQRKESLSKIWALVVYRRIYLIFPTWTSKVMNPPNSTVMAPAVMDSGAAPILP